MFWIYNVIVHATMGTLQLVGNDLQMVYDQNYFLDLTVPYPAILVDDAEEIKYFVPSLIKIK